MSTSVNRAFFLDRLVPDRDETPPGLLGVETRLVHQYQLDPAADQPGNDVSRELVGPHPPIQSVVQGTEDTGVEGAHRGLVHRVPSGQLRGLVVPRLEGVGVVRGEGGVGPGPPATWRSWSYPAAAIRSRRRCR
jgi:hypothetical protein